MGIQGVADYGVYISIGTLVSLVFGTGTIVWKFSRLEKENREWTEALIDNLRRDLYTAEREGIARADQLRQETGEVGHALRNKVHETETWNRDTFVRKDTFENVVNRIEKFIEKSADKLEAKLDKIINGSRA